MPRNIIEEAAMQCKAEPPSQLTGCAIGGRQSAKDMLLGIAERLRRQAHKVEALAYALPTHMGQEADEALWDLVIKSLH